MTTLSADLQAAAQQTRACVVALAGYRFGIEVRYAREVVVFDEYTIVPLAPAHLLGVANLRGNIVPIVDVRPLLDMAPAPGGHGVRALVVECEGVQAALLIDEVRGLEPIERAAPTGPGELIAGKLDLEGGAVTLLDVRALLGAMGGDAVMPAARLSEGGLPR